MFLLLLRFPILLIFFFGFTRAATLRATVYFASSDPASGAYALAYSSSGRGFPQAVRKNGFVGLAGSGDYVWDGKEEAEKLLDAGASAKVITDQLQKSLGDGYYRVLAVTGDGKISSFIPKSGCNKPECGERVTSEYAVAGGGLISGVLDKAFRFYPKQTDTSLFACRVIGELDSIYKEGGEVKTFVAAAIYLYDPTKARLNQWRMIEDGTREGVAQPTNLVNFLRGEMEKDGYACPKI